jgi:hypothetical protein
METKNKINFDEVKKSETQEAINLARQFAKYRVKMANDLYSGKATEYHLKNSSLNDSRNCIYLDIAIAGIIQAQLIKDEKNLSESLDWFFEAQEDGDRANLRHLLEPYMEGNLRFLAKYELGLMAFDLKCAYHINEDLGNFIFTAEKTKTTFDQSINHLCARNKSYWEKLKNIENGGNDFDLHHYMRDGFERKAHTLKFGY